MFESGISPRNINPRNVLTWIPNIMEKVMIYLLDSTSILYSLGGLQHLPAKNMETEEANLFSSALLDVLSTHNHIYL